MDEETALLHNFNTSIDASLHLTLDTYAKNPQLAYDHFSGINQNNILSDKDLETIYQMDNYLTKKLMITMTKNSDILVDKDFELLYKHNYQRLKSFYEVLCFQTTFEFLHTAFRDYVTVWKQSNDESALVIQLLESRSQQEILNSWTYEMAYNSPWASSVDIETEHLQITKVLHQIFKQLVY